MPPTYVCADDNFYTDLQSEAMDHITTYPDHGVVEVFRNYNGQIQTRLIRIQDSEILEED